MADFLSDNTTWLAVVLGLVAVAYGVGLTVYLLRQPAGDERMRSIAVAIQEGAQAYLTRQYTIIAGVAAVLFLLIGFLGEAVDSSLLGWKAAIGFLIAVPVGPAAALCIRRSITVGAMAGYMTGIGAALGDAVFGAVAAYVLIAFTFACLFGLLRELQPGAFHAAAVHAPDDQLDWAAMMYFSFTVLTSTGFGEITPVTRMARALIVIEQVLGVMYVAFLIARLANLYGTPGHRRA